MIAEGKAMPNAGNPARRALYGEESCTVPADFVHVETISARSELHDWTISPHSHAGIFQVVLILEGRARVVNEESGEAFDVQAGDVVCFPSGVPVTWTSKSRYLKKFWVITQEAAPRA